MKTNGLRNKKPAMARAAFRNGGRKFQAHSDGPDVLAYLAGAFDAQIAAVTNWHRAAKGRK